MNETTLLKFGMGASVRRKEDAAFITGRGAYTDDYSPPGVLHAFFLRSAVGHGRFTLGDLAAARGAPGVHLVWTIADIGGFRTLPAENLPSQTDGSKPWIPPRHALASEVVRYVGEPIALIVADTLEAARAAADLLAVDYDTLDAVVDPVAAARAATPAVWPQRGGNIAFDIPIGDVAEAEAVFAKAAKVSRLELVNNRLVANYMEPRATVAEYDPASERYTLTLGTQGGHGMRMRIAAVLGVPQERIRIITPDVGGGFGTKLFIYNEYPLLAEAARVLGRPVKWVSERTEHFLADSHGRDNVTIAEMAMDETGRFLALRVDLISNVGAYFSQFGGMIARGGLTMSTGLYDIPVYAARLRAVFTNTAPVDAYRGAGRPEAAYMIERLVDVCAQDLGLDRVALRKRNFIPPEKLPYQTRGGRTYDSGEFAGHLDRALTVSDQAGFAARREASKRRGRLRGFGVSCYVEAAAFPGDERATVTLNSDGSATLLIGTQSNGQGHATAYAQFVAGRLGLDYDKITVIQGDTDLVPTGGGTGGSRSIPIGVVSVDRAATELAEQVKALAAEELEVSAADVELAEGSARVAGTDRAIALAELAAKTADRARLTVANTYKQTAPTFPNGTHVCELEIDPDTGEVTILSYAVVDDFGATANPLLLAGQVHGGVAQGVGQALYERTVYDDAGQLLTATFLDYCMPRADHLPDFHFETRNVPCVTNPMGMKGAGEAGSVGACAAVVNALVDALEPYGVRHVDMPATPDRLWRVINGRGVA